MGLPLVPDLKQPSCHYPKSASRSTGGRAGVSISCPCALSMRPRIAALRRPGSGEGLMRKICAGRVSYLLSDAARFGREMARLGGSIRLSIRTRCSAYGRQPQALGNRDRVARLASGLRPRHCGRSDCTSKKRRPQLGSGRQGRWPAVAGPAGPAIAP